MAKLDGVEGDRALSDGRETPRVLGSPAYVRTEGSEKGKSTSKTPDP